MRVLQSAIQNHPQSYSLLHVQCDFLRSKGKTEWALKLAKQAVNCAPSEFVTWAKLTDVNMELGRHSDALLTLNSCPMFTYSERDQHRMPTPAKSHLPVKDFIAASGILDDEAAVQGNDADVALLRLPAPSLRGTFAKAYVLLAKLVSVIGWDELLKCRSQVFVMEEEYRMHRAADPVPESPLAPGAGAGAGARANGGAASAGAAAPGDGDDAEGFGPLAIATDDEGSEAASIKGVDSAAMEGAAPAPPSAAVPTIAVNGQTEDGRDLDEEEAARTRSSSPGGIPTIKVSTESDGEREREELRRFEESEAGRRARDEVAQPGAAKVPAEDKAGGDDEASGAAKVDGEDEVEAEAREKDGAAGFQNKRLCERWLDNLFMVLYEVRTALPLSPVLSHRT